MFVKWIYCVHLRHSVTIALQDPGSPPLLLQSCCILLQTGTQTRIPGLTDIIQTGEVVILRIDIVMTCDKWTCDRNQHFQILGLHGSENLEDVLCVKHFYEKRTRRRLRARRTLIMFTDVPLRTVIVRTQIK